MSGGTTALHGDCPVCGRKGVWLSRYLDRYGEWRLACYDEHECYAAFRPWQRRRTSR